MTQQKKQKRSTSSHSSKRRSTAPGVSAEDVRRLVAKLKEEDAKE